VASGSRAYASGRVASLETASRGTHREYVGRQSGALLEATFIEWLDGA
jgi:hypothetical protein